MTRNRTIAAIALVVLVGAVGLYVAYDQVLRGDAVAPLALPSADPAATPATAGASASTSAGGDTITATDVVGTWTVATGSQAGYRVRERLAQLDADSDAVGRTDQVSGSVTVAASGDTVQVTDATLEVDTTSISSDKSQRDNRLRTEGLQTDTYPTASFTLTTPVDVPAEIFSGSVVDVTLTGDLTLHGVTKSVSIPAQAQVLNGQIQIQGSISFALGDYDMVAPNVGGFILSIADEGALEFLVVLDRA
jgi:polyisoprenoid-binding protein YceI